MHGVAFIKLVEGFVNRRLIILLSLDVKRKRRPEMMTIIFTIEEDACLHSLYDAQHARTHENKISETKPWSLR